MFLIAVLAGFALALAAPLLYRLFGKAEGLLLALLPLGLLLYFASFIPTIAAGEIVRAEYTWVPSLGLDLTFQLDGLSLLFALLICLAGVLVLVYSSAYMAGHPLGGRYYAYMLFFMASMLGIALSSNSLALFVFWELTTVSSYLLIGFDHERPAARDGGMQALLVTGGGGLALLGGLLLLGQITGTYEIPEMVRQSEAIRSDALYLPILLLVLLGALTKSAQFPFHFWLPNAMEAPTPVSAYLHSATMVKAGIYLLARMSPVLGGTTAWHSILTVVGAATMLLAAMLAVSETDLKRILAYTTVSALGMLTLLLGIDSDLAAEATLAFLLSHALYKGALFLVAGIIDHEAGTRDIRRLGGLRRALPITAIAAGLATLSMAGLPPSFGFIGKELLYEAGQETSWAILLTGVIVGANVLYVAAAGVAGFHAFFGETSDAAAHAHEAPFTMWIGPLLLAILGLLFGLLPGLINPLVAAGVTAMGHDGEHVKLALWHGLNLTLLLSAATAALALSLYVVRRRLPRWLEPLAVLTTWGPERWYKLLLSGINGVARIMTNGMMRGYLSSYLLIIIAASTALVAYVFTTRIGLRLPENLGQIYPHEALLGVVIIISTILAVIARSHIVAAVALGVGGYAVALIYVLFGAPDLAITQVMVDSLTVILFVLVFYRLPHFRKLTNEPVQLSHVLVATASGAMVTLLVLGVADSQIAPPISNYYVQQSLPLAHGRNIVNVILVDFRALDTMGEIIVLTLAGIGVYALLKLRPERSED